MDDDDDHPLLVELDSLRNTAARFQHEAHTAAIRLQRHALDASQLHEHAAALEQENARLAHEIDILRAHSDVPHNPAVAQVQELSLALRRVSDKMTLTEDTLLERTSQLTDARSELARVRHAADGVYELAACMRAREEASKTRERELELKARASEEERKMVDLVVQEYAALVRNLEGRKSTPNGPASTLGDTLQDGKSTLHRMLTAFSTESENLHATIAQLNAKVSDLQVTLDAERVAASHDRTLLSQTKTELDKLNLEDQTAAKMVARYMKFSQASTNALQEQIMTLKTRHASTIATFELQLSIVESRLASERARTARLQEALDELCEDLARESYGRRREVALRLALLSREEGTAEFLRRWARRARELYARCYDSNAHVSSEDAVQEAFHRVVTDAESLLSTLDGDVQPSDVARMSGSLARITLARTAVDALRSELQGEVQKRLEAVQKSVFSFQNGDLGTSEIEDLLQPENTPSQRLLTPNGDARSEAEASPESTPSQDSDSPASAVSASEEIVDDPFIVSAPPTAEIVDHTIVEGVIRSLHLPSIQDGASTSATLLIEEPKAVQSHSPAVSILNLQEDLQPSHIEEPPTTDAPIDELPPISDIQDPTKEDTHVPSPMSTMSRAASELPSAANTPLTLLSELGTTKHRYDALQRAFRDCSLALKDLKRTLASPPSPHPQTSLHQHLETALVRIDDYAEDARVELEIRIADEELSVRGFEMVLSVPGAVDADERAEVETSARAFVDGTDEGVMRALEKFGKKLEDVQHDVAVVKRAVHGLGMEEEGEYGEDWNREGRDGSGDGAKDAGWTAWTAGLLGANTVATPSRSPTPVETFGMVMTSPRLRHAASLKQLHAQASAQGASERGPLAGLNLRIPMPSLSPSASALRGPYSHLGLGRASTMEGEHPRTLSAMYAVGGLRSASSIGLVGLGGSPSSARRGVTALGMGMGPGSGSPMRAGGARGDARGTIRDDGAHDLGGVE